MTMGGLINTPTLGNYLHVYCYQCHRNISFGSGGVPYGSSILFAVQNEDVLMLKKLQGY